MGQKLASGDHHCENGSHMRVYYYSIIVLLLLHAIVCHEVILLIITLIIYILTKTKFNIIISTMSLLFPGKETGLDEVVTV